MAAMASIDCPEYLVLEEYLPRICNAIISEHAVIGLLASDFWASGLIPQAITRSDFQPGVSSFDHATTIMTAALVSVGQDPSLFHVVTEKLGNQGLRPLARQMNKSLAQGVPASRPRSRSPQSRSRSILSATPLSEITSLNTTKSTLDYKCRTLKSKQEIKILVVGHNGSGKSSLINEIMGGKKLATVGRPDDQIDHDSVEKHRCKVGEIDVMIYDTRGLSDPLITDQSTMDAIFEIESIDIVLICYKLYDRVDDATVKELKVLVENMDDDLIDLSILIFTFGDEYQIRCDPEFDNKGKLTCESKQEMKKAMIIQQCQMEHKFKDAMKKNGINEKVAEEVPSCITCGKRKKNGEQKELPTSDNWVDDLWGLCEERCKNEAKKFVRSMRSTIIDKLLMGGLGGGTLGAVVGGIASGVKGGASIGTAVTPGVGTLAGAVGGVVVGGMIGGIYGTGAASAGIGARVASVVKGKK